MPTSLRISRILPIIMIVIFGIITLAPLSVSAAEDDRQECACSYYKINNTQEFTLKAKIASAWRTADGEVLATEPNQSACKIHCDYIVPRTVTEAFLDRDRGIKAVYNVSAAPKNPIVPSLGVSIPGLKFTDPRILDSQIAVNFIGEYVVGIYGWLIGAAAVFAIVMIIVGGIQYMTQSGAGDTKKAKDRITNAVIGFVLIMASYLILNVTNPQTTIFKPLTLSFVDRQDAGITAGLIENPGLLKTVDKFKAQGCPSQQEFQDGVTFFTTGYYKPGFGDKEAYSSFSCNIAMQCSCPGEKGTVRHEEEKSCGSGNRTWRPCKPFDKDTPYCNRTSSGATPVAYHTAAVSGCIPRGTVFKVFGGGVSSTIQAVPWYAEDGGGWIKGRRIDLFTGEGASAYQAAKVLANEVTLKFCPDNDPSKCPTN